MANNNKASAKPQKIGEISHTNKDIIAKVLTQNYPNKSLAVYGLTDLPKIKRMLSADYPVVTATEFYGDNVFLLEDDWLLVLEYESKPSREAFLKYNKYAIHAVERLKTEGIHAVRVVIAVLYTGDVQETPHELDLGSLKINVEQVYLSKFDTDAIYADLKSKVEAGENLKDEDIMRFIILPLTQPDKKRKQGLIKDTINLVKKVENDEQQAFIMAGILTATDKFIDRKYSDKMKEWMRMLRIVREMIDEAVEEAVEEAVAETTAKVTEETTAKVATETSLTFAKRMLSNHEAIPRIVEYTGLSRETVVKLQSELELTSA